MTGVRGRLWLLGATAGSLALGAAGPAQAHGVGQREDLPLPGWLFAWAAVAVLVVSFVALGALWQHSRFQSPSSGRPLVRWPVVLDVLLGAAGVAAFVLLVYAGLRGSQEPAENIVPTFVFIVLWVATPLVSALAGDVFALVNPWRALARAVAWMWARLPFVPAAPMPLAYPARLGYWPAALSVLAFGWLELVYADRDDPSVLALLMLVYAVVQLVGMSLFGIDRWTRRADGLAVYFGLFATLAPLQRRDGKLVLVNPLGRVAHIDEAAGLVAVVAVAIGVTSFDGLSNGPLWLNFAADRQRSLVDVGLDQTRSFELVGTFGLLVMCALIAGVYALGSSANQDQGAPSPAARRRLSYAHTLVPIALAYVVAHYLSYLVLDGQSIFSLISDPLGRGDDLFGTAQVTVNYALLGATTIWYVQVAVLIVGHAVALLLAHDRALSLHTGPRAAARSQRTMLAAMVAFTSLGLWLLSQAST